MADDKVKALLTPKFRVSFPSVFEKKAFGEGAAKYSVVALFKPAEFTDTEKKKWQAIRASLDAVCVEAFKKNINEMVKANPAFKVCGMPTVIAKSGNAIWYRRGETKPNLEGYGPGVAFFTLSSSMRRPAVVDKNGQPITAENEDELYAGCYARASVLPYAFDHKIGGKGASIGLANLQKLGDGESFSGFTSAEDDFGGDAAEFDAGEESVEEELDPTA